MKTEFNKIDFNKQMKYVIKLMEMAREQERNKILKLIDEELISLNKVIYRIEEINSMCKVWTPKLVQEYNILLKEKKEDKKSIIILNRLKQEVKELK